MFRFILNFVDQIRRLFRKESTSFTLKASCKCGADFYASFCGVDVDTSEELQTDYGIFMAQHEVCYAQDLEELPEDWKV